MIAFAEESQKKMEKESGNLFDLADQMMSDELAIPQLASVESHHWMTDYNMIRWA